MGEKGEVGMKRRGWTCDKGRGWEKVKGEKNFTHLSLANLRALEH